MPTTRPVVRKRDENIYDVNGDGWYYSDQASAVKYGILFGILVLGFIVVFSSWFHARSRLKKGFAPLPYHRWLVPRHLRARFEPHLREPEHNFSFYGRPQDYDMHAVPPPVYNPNLQQPPAYSGAPPAGFSKANAFQDRAQPQNSGEGSSGIATLAPTHHAAAAGYPPHPPQYS